MWDISAQASSMLETTLSGLHTRAVTGLDWSPNPQRLLATCSPDKNVCLWDLRASEKPVQTMASLPCGALAWNAAGLHLATTHGNDIRVWDVRSGDNGKPFVHMVFNNTVAALDWHPTKECEILTCRYPPLPPSLCVPACPCLLCGVHIC